MKKMFFALMVMLTSTMAASAMSYEQARNEALFLTDKMAYELNLTDEQYEAAYEINLDYLMGVSGRDDVFGTYWERRNLDLSYILFDWQWNAYIAASYFYRPLYWEAGYWHFGIYRIYPHRDYFYFGRPHFYATYRGGHAWHLHGTHGYYYNHRSHFRPAHREHFGMHDRWNRGDFRNPRHSSTRVTGRHDSHRIESRPGDRRIENRSGNRHYENRSGNRSFENRNSNSTNRNDDVYRHSESHRNNSSFGGYRGGSQGNSSHSVGSHSSGSHSSSSSHGSRSMGGGSHSSSNHSSSSGHFGGSRMGGRR